MDMDGPSSTKTFFRPPVKRRKFPRRRPEDIPEERRPTSSESSRSLHPLASQSQAAQDTQYDTLHHPGVSRPRQLRRSRKGGIEFSATHQSTEKATQSAASTVTAEELDEERVRAMCDRFTAHTGQTVDVDKHMMTYIESEMAKRNRRSMPADTTDSDTPIIYEAASGASTVSDLPRREPASLGKLHEIDLGRETTLENIARTEAATRRLAGDDEGAPPLDDGSPSKMVPLGRDEKLWRSRKRRTSDDVERDRLVEEVLRESRLDVYDEPAEEEAIAADDQAADDRVAEQFRRDFLDAIQSRRRLARARNTKTTKPEAPRGPKLGGSRSARAAMREMQEKSGRK
ncbi:telomere length and silencing 1 family protein [Aspergillus tanneri]|uniref:Hepatocellular carcinoma-associated antigen 59-domain-containing protein n=1 Tax=Aspergillus tanneri TaxID=1220188 RepID=A0A5M9N602_9EURO|nr:uncharacterized protein ATNIH1004_002687 [Aspergillus tanneri]KAA8650007.1 hypothetical protein ATNIH1004_002687 [Aspergillus tanneri]